MKDVSAFINPGMLKMFNMLPPNYDISKLPKEVIQSVARGEMPDLSLLPPDLLMYLRDNFEKLVGAYDGSVCYLISYCILSLLLAGRFCGRNSQEIAKV